jgi:hypothetical protein
MTNVVSPTKQEQTMKDYSIQDLIHIIGMVRKYAHRWNENPSQRMMYWVDRVNEYKREQPELWARNCCVHNDGFTSWDAYDLLA